MKGTARLIGSISGRAYPTGVVAAKAVATGALLDGRAITLSPIIGSGSLTRGTGLYHWLRVTPEQPQEVVWLDPYGIDYQIETSSNLKWNIV